MERRVTGTILVVLGIVGLLAFPLYATLTLNSSPNGYGYGRSWDSGWMRRGYEQPRTQASAPITLENARAIAEQYLVSLGNPNIAVKEIMEFENNFYVIYYEKDTGMGAFEMLIWKRTPTSSMMSGGMGMNGGMMGNRMMAGVITPEPGPNMMWNTKYNMMRGMMGSRWQAGTSNRVVVAEQDAKSVAEKYLSRNFPGANVEGITRFYGYYTIDFEKDGKIIGMLSVNEYSGDVWYHTWHGAFIQEVELA
jgi:hypothetical protein